MPPKTPRTPKTPASKKKTNKRQKVATPELPEFDWPREVREQDASSTQPSRKFCARCARDVAEHDGKCNATMEVLNKKKCRYCNKVKHDCDPIPRTMIPRFNHLLHLYDEMERADTPADFAAATAAFEQAQRTFNTELTAAQRATKRMGLQEGTPNKRPKSATDFANLQLQQMMQQTEIQARRVRHLGEIAAALMRISRGMQGGGDERRDDDDGGSEGGGSFQGVIGGDEEDDGDEYLMSGGLGAGDDDEDGGEDVLRSPEGSE